MNLDNVFRLINNFVHQYTIIAVAIVIGLIVLAFIKPKETVKTLLLVLGVAVAAYILYYLGTAAMSGVSGKHQMINH